MLSVRFSSVYLYVCLFVKFCQFTEHLMLSVHFSSVYLSVYLFVKFYQFTEHLFVCLFIFSLKLSFNFFDQFCQWTVDLIVCSVQLCLSVCLLLVQFCAFICPESVSMAVQFFSVRLSLILFVEFGLSIC